MAGYRRRLTGVHSWVGVLLGGLLFAIFWMGTLSVFDREIDRWMMPATRLQAPSVPLGLDALASAAQPLIPAGARQWRIDLPTDRTPVARFSTQPAKGVSTSRWLNPADGSLLPEPGTLGASGFFYPFHYGLHIAWLDLGKWLVGTAAMAMLLMLVSGVVIHRRLLADFFTFRPRKRLPRSTLDLHNVTGVIGLPFHFLIVLSGLVIFFNMYFPSTYQAAFEPGAKGKAEFQAQAYGRFSRPRAGTPGSLSSLDAMAGQAARQWGGGEPYFVRVWWPGDANSYVELRRSYGNEVPMNLDQLYFDAGTGRLLKSFRAAPVMGLQRVLSGLHFIQFRHAPLRWLYFVLGLSGCLMIGTGLVFWVESRPVGRKVGSPPGRYAVQAVTIACVSGIVLATLAYLAANRLLRPDAGLPGWSRAELEVAVFFGAWSMAFGHAACRGAKAWREQVGAIALVALACVALNAWSTGAWRSISPPVLCVDVALVSMATAAIVIGRRLGRAT